MWLLSKPLTRRAVVAAKFLGHAGGLLIAVVAIPWTVVYGLLGVAAGEPWAFDRTLATAGMLGLFVVFHLALVLALSTLTTGRVAVLTIPLVFIVSADLISAAIPAAFRFLPWSLGRLAGAHLAEGVVVTGWPILVAAAWTIALLGVAMARLNRAEF
ncbi:MAG: ABC transporter permease subunit [Nitriliruptoraceae bacterium]